MDVPAGVAQKGGHTGFLLLPSAVLAFSREKDSAVPFPHRPCCDFFVPTLIGMIFFLVCVQVICDIFFSQLIGQTGTKNLNTSRLFEHHPQVRGGNVKAFIL